MGAGHREQLHQPRGQAQDGAARRLRGAAGALAEKQARVIKLDDGGHQAIHARRHDEGDARQHGQLRGQRLACDIAPLKSHTINILFLLCISLGAAKYWASKTLQQSSNFFPRTIPAFAHLDLGIGRLVLQKDSRMVLKSSLFPDTKAPVTFSHIAKVGYMPFVFSLISFMILIA